MRVSGVQREIPTQCEPAKCATALFSVDTNDTRPTATADDRAKPQRSPCTGDECSRAGRTRDFPLSICRDEWDKGDLELKLIVDFAGDQALRMSCARSKRGSKSLCVPSTYAGLVFRTPLSSIAVELL